MDEYLDIKRVGFRKIEFLPSFLKNIADTHNSKYGMNHDINVDFNYETDIKPEMEFISTMQVACKSITKTTSKLEEIMTNLLISTFNRYQLAYKTSFIITSAYAEYHPNIGRIIYFTIKAYYIKPTLFQLLYNHLSISTSQENNSSKKQRKN